MTPQLGPELSHGELIVEVELGKGEVEGRESWEVSGGIGRELSEEAVEFGEDDARIGKEWRRLAPERDLDAPEHLRLGGIGRFASRGRLPLVVGRRSQRLRSPAVLVHVQCLGVFQLLPDLDLVPKRSSKAHCDDVGPLLLVEMLEVRRIAEKEAERSEVGERVGLNDSTDRDHLHEMIHESFDALLREKEVNTLRRPCHELSAFL